MPCVQFRLRSPVDVIFIGSPFGRRIGRLSNGRTGNGPRPTLVEQPELSNPAVGPKSVGIGTGPRSEEGDCVLAVSHPEDPL